MLKKLMLSSFLIATIASTSSALQISTEDYNVFPLSPTKIKKIDVSYGMTMVDYGLHNSALYNIYDLSTNHGYELATTYHYFPKNIKNSDPNFISQWVASAKSNLQNEGTKATVIPYSSKNGILIIFKNSISGMYLLDGKLYWASLNFSNTSNISNSTKRQLAEQLINTVSPK